MTSDRLRVLFLNTAFPPGVTGRFPSLYPTGHGSDTRMAEALSKLATIDSVGLVHGEVYGKLEPRDNTTGIEHGQILWDRKPELWYRWRAWRDLRNYYLRQAAVHGIPDVVLVRGLGPVFNHFIQWLRRQQPRPMTVLLFGDSSTFGRMGAWRRIRYALKPMVTPDDQAVFFFDACILASTGLRPFFEEHKIPWMWMTPAYNNRYEPPPPDPARSGPIRFGYFGALAEHAAILPTVQIFLRSKVPGSLHVCGYGKLSGELKALAEKNPNFRFDGLLQNQSECLDWAQQVDVLINPRLLICGLENSFPSKILEYGIAGKAILTTRTGGVDEVLKEEGLYVDAVDFENSLPRSLQEISAMDRAELQRRGTAIHDRIINNFSWDDQARNMVEFMTKVVDSPAGRRAAGKSPATG